MICQKCNKREASIYYNQIIDEEEIEVYLCSECAKEYIEAYFNLDKLTLSSDDITKSRFETLLEEEKASECKICNKKYEEFKKDKKLGCSNCYISFKNSIQQIIKDNQISSNHIGKIPNKNNIEITTTKELRKLDKELREAIRNEEFEKAALLRDKIKELEKNV